MTDTDPDYDPFNEIEKSTDTYARPRNVNTLSIDKVYEVIHISQKPSRFKDPDGSFPLNTLVQYNKGNLCFQSILPKKFNNKSMKWVEAMNKLILKKMAPKLVCYGTINMGHEVDLLRHTQDVDEAKLSWPNQRLQRTHQVTMMTVQHQISDLVCKRVIFTNKPRKTTKSS